VNIEVNIQVMTPVPDLAVVERSVIFVVSFLVLLVIAVS
jgi:hypothetical protein